jgi:hypothetical protein
LTSVTNSCGSAPTIVALDGDDFTLRDVVESPVFRACQLVHPYCLADHLLRIAELKARSKAFSQVCAFHSPF